MARKFKLMFVLMTVIVTVSISLLNIQIPNWNEFHLPIFSFLDGKCIIDYDKNYIKKNIDSHSVITRISNCYYKYLETSENIQHTKSRYSRIAVIREGDLPFASMDAYETDDNISPSYGNYYNSKKIL